MQYRVQNNLLFTSKIYAAWACGLLMLMVTSVIAETESPRYSVQKAAERSNPWALPQTQKSQPPFQMQPYDYGQQNQSAPHQPATEENNNQPAPYAGNTSQYQPAHQWQPQADRFVSPKFLESLKQQQKYFQVMPENQQYNQTAPRQYTPAQPQSGLPGLGTSAPGAYGNPSYGTGSVNPLYDVPAVSPWGDGPDVLYRGESYPLVPSEAVGGIPPLHVPSFGMKNSTGSDSGKPVYKDENNVFNPFTFLPR